MKIAVASRGSWGEEYIICVYPADSPGYGAPARDKVKHMQQNELDEELIAKYVTAHREFHAVRRELANKLGLDEPADIVNEETIKQEGK